MVIKGIVKIFGSGVSKIMDWGEWLAGLEV